MQTEPQLKLFSQADHFKKSLKNLHKPTRTNILTEDRRSGGRDLSTNKSSSRFVSSDKYDHRLQYMMSNLGH